MPNPFPGMNPYLERRDIWPDFHHRLITAIADALSPQVEPRYYVAVEQRTYILPVEDGEQIIRPDVAVVATTPEPEPSGGVAVAVATETAVTTETAVEITTVTLPLYERVRESYLEIRDAETHEVVTVIEVLSPSNKVPGQGRLEYEAKRRQVLMTLTSLVEIDLLRVGEPMPMKPVPKSYYRILVRRGWEGNKGIVYAFGLRHPIPEIPVPLRQGEKEAKLNLNPLLSDIYDRARYHLRLNYRQPPDPPLPPDDMAWVQKILKEKRLVNSD
ncbi:MAG: DUF4058 family protein [Armatimonadetes bacterium]|nr:DUF4058 family protein [Armatimonadota bacterium]